MELTGKVISVLPLQSGKSKNGEWKKQDFIIETASQYPKKVCVTAWGDKIDQFQVQEGQQITASIEVESREYNGRWYTDVKAWRVQKQGEQQSQSSPQQEGGSPDVTSFYNDEEDESLPF